MMLKLFLMFMVEVKKMTLTTQTIQEFFTETEWDMIYNFIGNALDNDDYECEDVYAIRAKIHNLFLVK